MWLRPNSRSRTEMSWFANKIYAVVLKFLTLTDFTLYAKHYDTIMVHFLMLLKLYMK